MSNSLTFCYSNKKTLELAGISCSSSLQVLERHVTLDKSWKGSDHAASLDPGELKQLVAAIRQVEGALGKPIKAIRPSEEACRGKLGKSLVAARDLKAGATIAEDMLVVKVR